MGVLFVLAAIVASVAYDACPQPPSQPVQEEDYFTVGSTKDEVLAIQGTPNSLSENRFKYGTSYVYFKNGGVTHWDNFLK